MKIKQIVSALLALLMVFGSVSAFFATPAYADSAAETTAPEEEEETPITGGENVDDSGFVWEDYVDYALNRGYKTIDDMLNSKYEAFELMMSTTRYELYSNLYTGDVVLKDKATGQYLCSNPASIANVTDNVKEELLSQVILTFDEGGSSKTFYSYTEAAKRNQITVAKIKNGVRVEYSIGNPSNEFLIPYWATKESFETKILEAMKASGLEETDFNYKQVTAYYTLRDPNKPGLTQSQLNDMYKNFPITKQGIAIYTIQGAASNKEKAKIENLVALYTTYSWEDQQADIDETRYVSSEKDPAIFKCALEYTLTDYGLQVDLPANSIRFNEDTFTLENISVLPFMGSGDINNDGYVFYPDGSGALLDFEDLRSDTSNTKGNGSSISGKIYGQDYAYQSVTGAHISTISLPVYGIVNTSTTRTPAGDIKTSSGFLAVITNGDSLASLKAGSSNTHYYSYAYPTFYPRPTDVYELPDATSVSGSNSTVPLESTRKYTGRYIINYVMLSDSALAAEAISSGKIDSYYESSWVGMAAAYRDYLEAEGVLSQLTAADVKDSLPLYIETFGSIPSVDRILSIPVNVNAPLTTFDDVQKMYDELSNVGITNINFKLTGYANGGLTATYPAKLKWMKELGGKEGYDQLLDYAKENGFGVYPEFDFAYISYTDTFDGININKIASKTMNDRYASKQIYDAALQMFYTNFELCVSGSVMSDLYTKFEKKWTKSDNIGISVSTLGNALNSDFDTEDPHNREDVKGYISELLATISENNESVMTNGGNAYTLKYVNHIIDAALDSSRYNYASASVPFVGFVLHGYMNFAGSAINMAGDFDYQLLKAIENGASPYFILSYDNTELLKEWFTWSQYFSINYEIWFEELVELYNVLNEAIGDLQDERLVGHSFLTGTRVYDELDIENNSNAEAEITASAGIEAVENANAEILEAFKNLFSIGRITSGLTADDVPYVLTVVDDVLAEVTAERDKYDAIVAEINASGRGAVVANIDALALEIVELGKRSSSLTVQIANEKDSSVKATLVAEKNEIEATIKAKTEEQKALTESLSDFEPQYTENSDLLIHYNAQVTFYTEMKAMLIRNTENIDEVIDEHIAASIKAYYDEIAFAYEVTDDLVCVEYENGVQFILNYNTFTVEVELNGTTYTIEPYGFVKLD